MFKARSVFVGFVQDVNFKVHICDYSIGQTYCICLRNNPTLLQMNWTLSSLSRSAHIVLGVDILLFSKMQFPHVYELNKDPAIPASFFSKRKLPLVSRNPQIQL